MQKMKPFLSVIIIVCLLISHPVSFAQPQTINGHPAWIMQGNIYEVNVRQYTPEGTFAAFAKNLPRLKSMGVQTLWFMPINPISKTDRKGSLGSYYAVSDYGAINPEYGTMEDWKNLVAQCHSMGFKVIIDWVPNHTGADNYWLVKHPDFFVKDSTGKAVMAEDWADTRKLNYNNPEMEDSMIAAMKFWIDKTNIDGFRCDHAVGPTETFWKKCISELKSDKNILMLAEADNGWMYESGFDMTYPWKAFHTMVEIAAGKRRASALDSIIHIDDSIFPKNALEMYFTSDHDENSWNKADYETMPGASHAPFSVLTQTIGRGVPLIYSGQEEPFLRAIRFFDKDTIQFKNYARASFYKKLLNLRKQNPALAAYASFNKLKTNNDAAIYAFERNGDGRKVLVLLNLTNAPQTFAISNHVIEGAPLNVFSNKTEMLKNDQTFHLAPWGYSVYSY
jgi:alpha-amylase